MSPRRRCLRFLSYSLLHNPLHRHPDNVDGPMLKTSVVRWLHALYRHGHRTDRSVAPVSKARVLLGADIKVSS